LLKQIYVMKLSAMAVKTTLLFFILLDLQFI